MLKKILPILLALTVLLSACAPQGTPTMAPADVQGTAVSAAWTIVALTQAAIPTATPLPPTETPSPTPLPTFTAVPLPLLELPTLPPVLPTATTAAASGETNCLGPIDFGASGKVCRVRIENESGGSLSPLSLNLWTPNAFGQCGAMSLNVAVNGKEFVELPVGNWYGYAWVNLKNGQSTSSGNFVLGQGCDDLLSLVVKENTLGIKGP